MYVYVCVAMCVCVCRCVCVAVCVCVWLWLCMCVCVSPCVCVFLCVCVVVCVGVCVDESVWSDVDLLRSVKPFSWSYAVSKVLSEKAVLEFGEQNGLEVTTLVLPFVLGGFVCPKLPDSVERALLLPLGMNAAPYFAFSLGLGQMGLIFLRSQ